MDIKKLNENLKFVESVDMYDLKDVLGDKYEVSYVTELERDGKRYEAWFIHEKNEKGFTGKQIKDEKLYKETAEKLKKAFPDADIQVTSRQYKYAPEIVECMILLPIEVVQDYENLKIGDKFKFDDEPDYVYEVQDITADGYRECKRTDKNGYTNVLDIYPEDVEKHPITLITDESLNEETAYSQGGTIFLDIPTEIVNDVCIPGRADEKIAEICEMPEIRKQLNAISDEDLNKWFNEFGDFDDEERAEKTRLDKEQYLVWDCCWNAFEDDEREMDESTEARKILKSLDEVERIYYLYAGYYELYLTDHKLTPPYMYQAENTDLNQLINDNLSETDEDGEWTNPDAAFNVDDAHIIFDVNIKDEINNTDMFSGIVSRMADEEELEDNGFYDLSKYYADKNESLNESNEFDYMLLDRLQTDCSYFIKHPALKFLWAGDIDGQIAKMKELYNKVPEKPEWLSLEDIDNYEKQMKAAYTDEAKASDEQYNKNLAMVKESSDAVVDKVSAIRKADWEDAMADEKEAKDEVNGRNANGDQLGTHFSLQKFSKAHKDRLEKQHKLERNKELVAQRKARLNKTEKDESLNEKEDREVLKIKFIGVDEWNRPAFKPVDKTKKYYLTDVNNLFSEGATEEEVKKFYADKKPLRDFITYHGYSLDDDPMGSKVKFDLEIV